MVRPPGERRWNRLRFVVERQRGEIAPCRIAAGELDAARSGHQPKEQPQHQPDAESRRIERAAQPIAPRDRRDEDGEESCLEQQRVPLERQEWSCDGREPQVQGPEHWKQRNRRDTQEQERRQNRSGQARATKPSVGDTCRHDAGVADQTENLRCERPERGQVREGQQAEKPPAGERVCRRPGIASPHHRRHARRDVAVLRNRSIDQLGHGARDWDSLVEMDRQPRAYRREETKHRFRGLGDAAVRFDELNGAGTAVLWNLRKPLRDISALIRRELDEAA